MEYIKLDKNDYQIVMKNLNVIPNIYPSGNRRAYIAKWGLIFCQNCVTLETIQEGLKYFKKLKREAEKEFLSENAEYLSEVVSILEKYNKTK